MGPRGAQGRVLHGAPLAGADSPLCVLVRCCVPAEDPCTVVMRQHRHLKRTCPLRRGCRQCSQRRLVPSSDDP